MHVFRFLIGLVVGFCGVVWVLRIMVTPGVWSELELVVGAMFAVLGFVVALI